jgi:Lrp/AsnC family transcriptional regulator, leucine-responsive regulatory protein
VFQRPAGTAARLWPERIGLLRTRLDRTYLRYGSVNAVTGPLSNCGRSAGPRGVRPPPTSPFPLHHWRAAYGTGPGGYRIQVEEINRTIVALLARDGRMSFTELARRTGLSVSAAQQRVRRLERSGVIKGYAALIDPNDAGLPLTAFVSIKPFDPAAADDAPERLAHLSAIEACHSVAGDENYILKVRVASPAELEQLLQEIRAAASMSTRTTIVLSTPYENRPPNV